MSTFVSDREKWFTNRVGRLIFRTANNCSCHACNTIYEDGQIIRNKEHARWLYGKELEAVDDGRVLIYFSTREDRDEFVQTQKAPVD